MKSKSPVVLLLLALVAPAAAAVCMGSGESHCASPASTSSGQTSDHSCCDTPRLTGCECADDHGDRLPALVGDRKIDAGSTDLVLVSIVDPRTLVAVSAVPLGYADSSPPHREGVDLLALNSTLLL